MVAVQSPAELTFFPSQIAHCLSVRLELSAQILKVLGWGYWCWGCYYLWYQLKAAAIFLERGYRYLAVSLQLGILAQGLWLPSIGNLGERAGDPKPAINLGLAALISLFGHGLVIWGLGLLLSPPRDPLPPPISIQLLPPPPPPQPATDPAPADLPPPPPVQPRRDPPPPPPVQPRRDPPPRALTTPPLPTASPSLLAAAPVPAPQPDPVATSWPVAQTPSAPAPLATPIPRLTPLIAARAATPAPSASPTLPAAPAPPVALTAPETLAKPIPGANPPPPYPPAARQMHQQGQVILRAKVSPQGSVVEVEISQSSGFPALDHAAQTTVRQWHFTPAQRNGTPIESWVTIPIRFSLN